MTYKNYSLTLDSEVEVAFEEVVGETEIEAWEELRRLFMSWSNPELDFQPTKAPQVSPELTRLFQELDFSFVKRSMSHDWKGWPPAIASKGFCSSRNRLHRLPPRTRLLELR